MKHILFMLSTLLLTSPAISLGATTSCVDEAKANAVLKDFDFYGNAKFDLCDPKDPMTQAVRGLIYLKTVTLGKARGPFALNFISDSPYPHLKSKVSKFIFEDTCENGIAAYVADEERTVHVCPWEMNNLDMAATLMHESRHLDAGSFQHQRCVRGTTALQPDSFACDPTYQWKGAYAVDVDFYNRIAATGTTNPALRKFAKSMAQAFLVERFNSLPGDLKDGLYLLDNANNVLFFDGKTIQFVDVADSGTKPYLDQTTTEDYFCKLTRQDLTCTPLFGENRTPVNIHFSQVSPQSLYEINDGTGHLQLTLTDTQGRIAKLPNDFEGLRRMRESDIAFKKNSENIFKVQQMKPYIYASTYNVTLTLDGKIHLQNGMPYPAELSSRRFKNIAGPYVWSPALDKL